MSYKDVFGFDPDEGVPSAPLPDVTPAMPVPPVDSGQADSQQAVQTTQTVDEPAPLLFSGFSSGRPLLIERPSRYLSRIRGGVESLLILPPDDEQGGDDARTLCSPIVSLPYPILYGNEMFPDEDAAAYPLLRAPANHPFDPDTDSIDVYALTVSLSLYASGMMLDDGTDLLAYPLPSRYEIPDQTWDAAAAWADAHAQQLASLNLGRVFGFTLNHPDEERNWLTTLFRAWDVTIANGDEILADAYEAADKLAEDWPFDSFEPYKE